MIHKERLSATVDADLLRAAEDAIARGDAPTISAWVNDALRLKLEHERRLRGMAEFIADFEARSGIITDEDIARVRREMKGRALRPKLPRRKGARRRGGR